MQIIRKKKNNTHLATIRHTVCLLIFFHNLIFLFSEIKPMYIVQTISTDGISEKLYPKNHKKKKFR